MSTFRRETIEFAAGAAAGNVLITIPEVPKLFTVVMGLRFSYTTDVNVAIRVVSVQLQQTGKPSRTLVGFAPGQPASLAISYNIGRWAMQLAPPAIAGDAFAPLPYNATENTFNLNLLSTNRQAGDVFSSGYVELFRVEFEELICFM